MTLERTILIVGYGSVGRRHLRNLQSLGHKNFVILRTGKSTLPDDEIVGIPTEYSLKKALAHRPVATIIANPTALHIPVALAAAEAGSHIFLEKPISDSMVGIKKLQGIVSRKKLVLQVGFQFRFHPGLLKIKSLLEKDAIGSVVSVQARWGEYLPNWHPWEDYRVGYSASKDLGGGVLLTMCHSFDYLRWLIGEVKNVSAVTSNNGGLGIDVEDSADVLLNFKSGIVGNVHLDYLENPGRHYLNIIGQNGVISWDNNDGMVKWFSGKTGKWEKIPAPKDFERNDLFVLEMKNFISCIIKNEQSLCTIGDGIETLKIVLAAKKSVLLKRIVKV